MSKPAKVDRVCAMCIGMPSATVDNAFGPETNVYRIADKIFALVSLADPTYVTLKTLPEEGEALRAQYDFVRPGYYMNKRHWITVDLVHKVPMDELAELIEESYRLVIESLPKKTQVELSPN